MAVTSASERAKFYWGRGDQAPPKLQPPARAGVFLLPCPLQSKLGLMWDTSRCETRGMGPRRCRAGTKTPGDVLQGSIPPPHHRACSLESNLRVAEGREQGLDAKPAGGKQAPSSDFSRSRKKTQRLTRGGSGRQSKYLPTATGFVSEDKISKRSEQASSLVTCRHCLQEFGPFVWALPYFLSPCIAPGQYFVICCGC